MDELYFEWLLERAGVSSEDDGYSILCRILHEKTFYPIVERDDDRCKDGARLRLHFANEQASDFGTALGIVEKLNGVLHECTVLELMISLAEHMEYELAESRYQAYSWKWFDEMIDNLGLDRYMNAAFMEDEDAYFDVSEIIDRFVFRQYGSDGQGGLFPLSSPDYDQQSAEIIMQMNNYIAENYDIS